MERILRASAALFCCLSLCLADSVEVVHPDYALAELRMPAAFKTMGLGFLTDGTLVLATTESIGGGEVPQPDANGKVLLIKGISPDSLPAQIKEVSNYWRQLSGVVVANGRLFVSDRDGFYEIPDLKAPVDVQGNRKALVKWPNENHWNNGPYWHQWAFTPQYRNGYFYAPYSGSIRSGGWSSADPTSKLSGAVLRWELGGRLQAFAGGLRSPNGANLDTATGELFVTDNQGSWEPASSFLRIRQGRFYGHRQSSPDLDSAGQVIATHAPNFAEDLPYDPPVAWLPYGVVRSSPSQPVLLHQGAFAGDWLLGDVNHPGLVRVALDRVGGECNGAVFNFSQGTGNAAINRMAEAPDGSIVIGTLTKIAGNWPSGEKCPLYRLKAKSQASAFDLKAVRVLQDGLELSFTLPVNPDSIRPGNFKVSWARYIRQKEYGLGKQPDQARMVLEAEASADRRRVYLKLDSLKTDRVLDIKVDGVVSSGGKRLWGAEAWFTLNYTTARKWSAASIGIAPRPASGARPEPSLRAVPGGQGSLDVTVRCGAAAEGCGPDFRFRARLLSPAGEVLAARPGYGTQAIRFQRPGRGPGLYLLQILSNGESGKPWVTQRVVF